MVLIFGKSTVQIFGYKNKTRWKMDLRKENVSGKKPYYMHFIKQTDIRIYTLVFEV